MVCANEVTKKELKRDVLLARMLHKVALENQRNRRDVVIKSELGSLLEAAERAHENPDEVVESIGEELFAADVRYIREKLYWHLEWLLNDADRGH